MSHVKKIQVILLLFLILNSFFAIGQVFNNYYSALPTALTGNIGIQAPDGGYVVGGSSGNDLQLTKTNSQGAILWSNKYDVNKVNFGESISSISIIQNHPSNINGYLITGTTNNDFFTVPNSSDAFVMKTDYDGNVIWIHAFTRTNETGTFEGFDGGIKGQELSDGSLVVSINVLGDGGVLRLTPNGDYLNGSAATSIKVVNAGGCCPVAFSSGENIKSGILNAASNHYLIVGDASNNTLSFNYFYLLDFNLLPFGTAPTLSFGKMLGGSLEKKSLNSADKLPNGDYITCGYTEQGTIGPAGD